MNSVIDFSNHYQNPKNLNILSNKPKRLNDSRKTKRISPVKARHYK